MDNSTIHFEPYTLMPMVALRIFLNFAICAKKTISISEMMIAPLALTRLTWVRSVLYEKIAPSKKGF